MKLLAYLLVAVSSVAAAAPVSSNAVCKASTKGRTITWGADQLVVSSDVSKNGSVKGTLSVQLGKKPFIDVDFAGDGARAVTVNVKYADDFWGVRAANISTRDGKTLDASFDGRKVKSFARGTPAQNLVFTDGKPVPTSKVPDQVRKEMNAFMKAVQQASCGEKHGELLHPTGIMLADAAGGHVYLWGAQEATCLGCQSVALGGLIGCFIAVATGCTSAGVYSGICVAVGAAACLLVYAGSIAACLLTRPGPCCPVACGVGCCGVSDSCLDPSTGECCPSSHPQACAASVCCNSSDQCGNANAVCCPLHTTICGTACCAQGLACQDSILGICCAPGQTCASSMRTFTVDLTDFNFHTTGFAVGNHPPSPHTPDGADTTGRVRMACVPLTHDGGVTLDQTPVAHSQLLGCYDNTGYWANISCMGAGGTNVKGSIEFLITQQCSYPSNIPANQVLSRSGEQWFDLRPSQSGTADVNACYAGSNVGNVVPCQRQQIEAKATAKSIP